MGNSRRMAKQSSQQTSNLESDEVSGLVPGLNDLPQSGSEWAVWHADGDGEDAATPHRQLRVHRAFRSRILPDPRDLIVYVPPGYDLEENAGRCYAVLYLNDGQNLFDPETSFIKGRTWQVREAADQGIEAGDVEPLIIVGIYNTGDRRLAEYTHERDWQMGGGEADLYGEMLVRELMPWIAEHYRVKAGREHTGIGGSSLGGLVSLYLGLRYPEVLGRLAVISPSVWWNHRSILGVLAEAAPAIRKAATRPRIWLDIGDSEGRMALRDAELLAERLRANGWRKGETLHFEKIRGGKHDEASWALRVGPMLRFLFPASARANDDAGHATR
jgi:predicted alpha/beta superfamily hydrolase